MGPSGNLLNPFHKYVITIVCWKFFYCSSLCKRLRSLNYIPKFIIVSLPLHHPLVTTSCFNFNSEGRLDPSPILDLSVSLDEVASGYAAMDQRRAI
jgi:hypothetical protein